jgi:hypothetical protein
MRDRESLAGDTPKSRDRPDKKLSFDKRDSACVQKQEKRMEWSGEEIYCTVEQF